MDKDEKKMIEEMAQVLCNRRCEDCELLGVSCGCKSYCTRLYNAGCRIIADDEIVIKKSEYKELKKYRTDWLNSEKMHLQAELEDTEFELGCSNRLFQKVCEEKKELEKRLEQVKQETAREILQALFPKEDMSTDTTLDLDKNGKWVKHEINYFTIYEDEVKDLAKAYGIELED